MQPKIMASLGGFFALVYLTGCGGGGGPTDSNIHDAIQQYCEAGNHLPESIKLPASPGQPNNLLNTGSKVRISDIRVIKRGKLFYAQNGNLKGFPVRVYVKGMRIDEYSKFIYNANGKMEHVKDVNLPFDGEGDFVLLFEPPDKSKVDPGPGKWIASPN